MTYKTLPKPAQSNKQVKEYVDAVRQGSNGRFVIPNGKGWYVRRADSRTSELFGTKSEAIAHAQAEVKEHKAELFIFDKTGQLTDRQAV